MTSLNQIAPDRLLSSTADRNPDRLHKYIAFKLADYSFALPSEDILRVVATPPPSQGGMVSMGLVQLAQYSIQILNLPELLSLKAFDRGDTDDRSSDNRSQQDPYLNEFAETAFAQNPPFLIVLRDADESLWGIAVHEPPDLIEISDRSLNPVPPEKRLLGALQGVSYIGSYGMEGDRHTLLILDVPVLCAHQQIDVTPDQASSVENNATVGIEPALGTEPYSEVEFPVEIEPPLEVEAPLGIEPPLDLRIEPPLETGLSLETGTPLETELPLGIEPPLEVEPSLESEPPLGIEPPLEIESLLEIEPLSEIDPPLDIISLDEVNEDI
ncbi:chemotaxis protein CheW [cf. Phormidesmis sp. LEGE 11477]|uniref:chemotaxis protein CheW n=1 Tax=cf. Phormidesmis sp. LEGE 11477 TaxID=1828680 RepID=UPI0018809708|nr:chemotaxis protein CheW [cf. Phormidesmis sp. LEGE 11477]MBE9060974.1 chemotaxis protein CheW [cf. Phormidesmis sp. LEGE 11477]